jgi:protein ImuB
MKWLYIHFPHLYGETWLPDFHGQQPLALIQAQQQVQMTDDINQAAKTRGVDVAMSLNTAFCLCPTLQVTTQDSHRQTQALERVATIASRYSAWVGLDQPNGLYLEIASMQRLFGEARWIQHTLQNVFQQKGYTTVIAAAPQAKAARLLAKANQACCYQQNQLMQHLRNIAITALDIAPKTEVRLMKLGIRHVHDLVQLPSGDLRYRIDAELALYLDQIVGRQTWLPIPFKVPERFRWMMDLEQEFESLEPLRFFLANGIQQFCDFLQKRSLAAQELQLTLQHRRQAPTLVDVKLASLDNRSESWQYMLNAIINRLQLPAPITALRLSGSLFETLSDQKLYLFKSISQDCSQKKTQLLNRLGARLGIDNLHFLQITTDPRPERQSIYTQQPVKNLESRSITLNTPMCLLPQPQRINKDQYCLNRGPVRLATGWWDRNTVHRDYYVASDKNLSAQWLFLDASGHWYQHGWFG